FRDEDVADYARKWFSLDSDTSSDEADAFISESESVPDLRSNPLLLSLMCILYRGEGSLPRNRAEIYEQCSNLLFRKWDARRRIHQDLRAGHLVEPALRHLAWWLFTREDTHSAVTERELVNATTEFLHGRGFESVDDAREAAREFIEFCRGRMWVFTDTGTTASGENLYSFTHRTFLEYFAAAQLAYDSDTPEKLAKTIAPHIAKGEWEVVGELAVQIKDSTSTEGAKRVYETLLNERRRRSIKTRSNILRFLTRSLRSTNLPPLVVRHLTREVVSIIFPDDTEEYDPSELFHYLLHHSEVNIHTIADEIQTSIEELIGSESGRSRQNGIVLAISLGEVDGINRPALEEFWIRKSNEITQRHASHFISEAHTDEDIRFFAFEKGLITIDQALRMSRGIDSLIAMRFNQVTGDVYAAVLHRRLWRALHASPESTEQEIRAAIDDLASFGIHLARTSGPPWADGPTDSLGGYSWETSRNKIIDKFHISPVTYLGGAAIILMSAEFHLGFTRRDLNSDPTRLNHFSDLYWYIESRETGNPDPQQLPDLPVPDDFKQIFRDWAARKINFVAVSPGDQARTLRRSSEVNGSRTKP
ncbi:MAG: hypothetical protein J2P31_13595, partial [Blastocatellia bacterium]|nr:hypothetical protein [Blastocatellia bacterium]